MTSHIWILYFYSNFEARFLTLEAEVLKLKANKTDNLKEHPKVKLYVDIVNALKKVRENPLHKDYHLGNTLGKEHSDWKRVKKDLPPRYRMFFKFFSTNYSIFIAWLNDENTLRKEGAKSDCYKVFKRKLQNEIPSSYKSLFINSSVNKL